MMALALQADQPNLAALFGSRAFQTQAERTSAGRLELDRRKFREQLKAQEKAE